MQSIKLGLHDSSVRQSCDDEFSSVMLLLFKCFPNFIYTLLFLVFFHTSKEIRQEFFERPEKKLL